MSNPVQKYDVALSFAGEDREYVRSVAIRLRDLGLKVFYDEFERLRLWGLNLIEELKVVYEQEARFVIMFVSAAYSKSKWTRLERRAAFNRVLESESTYVLPVRFDDTELVGLDTAVAYLNASEFDPHALADFIDAKVRNSGAVSGKLLLPDSDVRSISSGGIGWRISRQRWSTFDTATRFFDGRWHKKGMDVLYLAPSLSLAILEAFPVSEITSSTVPGELYAIRVNFPPAIEMSRVELSVLPPGWNSTPGPPWLKDLGESWVQRGQTCILSVPASQAELESIYVVNTKHPIFTKFSISEVHPFTLSDL